MTAATPDPWMDAWQAATQPVLDQRLAAVRRRVWLREAKVLVVGGGALLAATLGLSLWLTPDFGTLWSVPVGVARGGFGLACLGLVLIVVANVRSSVSGLDRSLVGPDAYLPQGDRAWFRDQIAHGRPVPAERRFVVIALARRMQAEGLQALAYVGVLCFYVGTVLALPLVMILVVFTALTIAMGVRVARALLWSGRARRWLAAHA